MDALLLSLPVACGLRCHKECHLIVSIACREVELLRDVAPVYLMAGSSSECQQWLRTVMGMRRNWLVGSE